MNLHSSGPHQLDFDEDLDVSSSGSSSTISSTAHHSNAPHNFSSSHTLHVGNLPPSASSRLKSGNTGQATHSPGGSTSARKTHTHRNIVPTDNHDESFFTQPPSVTPTTSISAPSSHQGHTQNINALIDWNQNDARPGGGVSTSARGYTPPPLPATTHSKTLTHSHPPPHGSSSHHQHQPTTSKRAEHVNREAQPQTHHQQQQPQSGQGSKTLNLKTPVPPSIVSPQILSPNSTSSSSPSAQQQGNVSSPPMPKFRTPNLDQNTSAVNNNKPSTTISPDSSNSFSFDVSPSQQQKSPTVPIQLQISPPSGAIPSQPSPQPPSFGSSSTASISSMPANPFINNVSNNNNLLVNNNNSSNSPGISLNVVNNTGVSNNTKPLTSFADLNAPLSKSNGELQRPTIAINNISSGSLGNFGVNSSSHSNAMSGDGSSSASANASSSSLQFLSWQPSPSANPQYDFFFPFFLLSPSFSIFLIRFRQ
jgi:hypothetical protein